MRSVLRINRFLAAAGLGSRRKCEELIRKGVVFVNARRVETLTLTIDPEKDSVTVLGKSVTMRTATVVLVLNKPVGVLSAVTDSFDRKTVIDIAREKGYEDRLFPVGRLDLDTSGLLILTNDGDLAYRLTHPRFKIDKTYRVTVEGNISDEVVSRIASGIKTDDFVTQPCEVTVTVKKGNTSELTVTLREGMKRQVRRMFAFFGHKVIALHRTTLGDLEFKDLKLGEIRPLTKREERRLRELTGLA